MLPQSTRNPLPARLALLGAVPPPRSPSECSALSDYLAGKVPAYLLPILRWCAARGLHDVLPAIQRDCPGVLLSVDLIQGVGAGQPLADYVIAHPGAICSFWTNLDHDDPARVARVIQGASVTELIVTGAPPPAALHSLVAALAHAHAPLTSLVIQFDHDDPGATAALLAACGPSLSRLVLNRFTPASTAQLQRIASLGNLRNLVLRTDWPGMAAGLVGVSAGLQGQPVVEMDLELRGAPGLLPADPATTPVLDGLIALMQKINGAVTVPSELLDADAGQRLLVAARLTARIRSLLAGNGPAPQPTAAAMLQRIQAMLAHRFPRDPELLAHAVSRALLTASFQSRGVTFPGGVDGDLATNLVKWLDPITVVEAEQVNHATVAAGQRART